MTLRRWSEDLSKWRINVAADNGEAARTVQADVKYDINRSKGIENLQKLRAAHLRAIDEVLVRFIHNIHLLSMNDYSREGEE